MKFELNEYHRNVSDKELIADVQATAKKMGKSTLTAKEYSEQGNYNSSTQEDMVHGKMYWNYLDLILRDIILNVMFLMRML